MIPLVPSRAVAEPAVMPGRESPSGFFLPGLPVARSLCLLCHRRRESPCSVFPVSTDGRAEGDVPRSKTDSIAEQKRQYCRVKASVLLSKSVSFAVSAHSFGGLYG